MSEYTCYSPDDPDRNDTEIERLTRYYLKMSGPAPEVTWNQEVFQTLQYLLLTREMVRLGHDFAKDGG